MGYNFKNVRAVAENLFCVQVGCTFLKVRVKNLAVVAGIG